MFSYKGKKGGVRLVTIVLIVALLLIIEGVIIVNKKKNKSPAEEPKANNKETVETTDEVEPAPVDIEDFTVKGQIVRKYETEDHEDEITDEFEIAENVIISLSQNDEFKQYGISASDITIKEINSEAVKISRDAIRYNENGEETTETVEEEIGYEKDIPTIISDAPSTGPDYAAARYTYYIRFVKQ